jgi:predicted nuclease with TOPRIM domain
MLRAAATVSDLRAEKEEAIASFHRIADHCEALADSNARLSETKNMLQGEVERLCGTIESLRQENAQLRGNLMTFRDGFKAKLSQMAMEARFWNIDIPEQLAS